MSICDEHAILLLEGADGGKRERHLPFYEAFSRLFAIIAHLRAAPTLTRLSTRSQSESVEKCTCKLQVIAEGMW